MFEWVLSMSKYETCYKIEEQVADFKYKLLN